VLVGVGGQIVGPGTKVTYELVVSFEVIVEGDGVLSLCAIAEHELGPLDHVTSVGFSKCAHVLRSEVVKGGKLEREGADCRDQEEGQVCGDGREWVYSGLGEQGGVHCNTAG
jgi:hypothetical protein